MIIDGDIRDNLQLVLDTNEEDLLSHSMSNELEVFYTEEEEEENDRFDNILPLNFSLLSF